MFILFFCVLEKHFKIGGYTHTFKREGFEWDVGIHYIGGVHNKKSFSTYINNHKITVPHPRMKTRNFVLIPLLEVCKNWIHPKSSENISELISKFNFKDLRSIKLY